MLIDLEETCNFCLSNVVVEDKTGGGRAKTRKKKHGHTIINRNVKRDKHVEPLIRDTE
jgi:hypothetical protein